MYVAFTWFPFLSQGKQGTEGIKSLCKDTEEGGGSPRNITAVPWCSDLVPLPFTVLPFGITSRELQVSPIVNWAGTDAGLKTYLSRETFQHTHDRMLGRRYTVLL